MHLVRPNGRSRAVRDRFAEREGGQDDDQDHSERERESSGKLADVELHFDAADGVLEGLKLIGFAIWERWAGGGRNVTFPARQYSVNGQRRSFALLRPTVDTTAQERIRDLILQAYAEQETEVSEGIV
jgi:hypothetical protein